MAIEPHARENLFEEAIAYQRRLLFRHHDTGPTQEFATSAATPPTEEITELFMGLRGNGAWSIYFDEDPVLQFTPRGELRRLYFDGVRFVAVRGNLAGLHRQRVGGRMRLEPHPVTPERQIELIDACADRAALASRMLQSQALALANIYPNGDDELVRNARELLARVAAGFAIAQSAGV